MSAQDYRVGDRVTNPGWPRQGYRISEVDAANGLFRLADFPGDWYRMSKHDRVVPQAG